MSSQYIRVPMRLIVGVGAVLTAFSTFMSFQLELPGGNMKYWELPVRNAFYWMAWAAAAPIVIWLSQRFRFERQRWRLPLALHVGAGIAFTQLHIFAIFALHRGIAWYFDRALAVGFWPALRNWSIQYTDWEMITYWAIVGVGTALSYQDEARDRALAAAKLETTLVETRLQALQTQLHPHFLFNTLHAVSALMHRDVTAADRMVARLADLLRMTLDHIGATEVVLKEELEFVGRYLEIQQTRFQDRLSVRMGVDPDTLDALVPWMLLQPLVENAIKHGISPRPGPGTIEIETQRAGEFLMLEVADDGPGLSRDPLAGSGTGIGVSTTEARLKYQFGSNYKLEFLRRAKGVRVRVTIPWRVAASELPVQKAG
jgi:signal transduction histidine kinase